MVVFFCQYCCLQLHDSFSRRLTKQAICHSWILCDKLLLFLFLKVWFHFISRYVGSRRPVKLQAWCINSIFGLVCIYLRQTDCVYINTLPGLAFTQKVHLTVVHTQAFEESHLSVRQPPRVLDLVRVCFYL